MLTNEKYNFPVFILIDGINVCEITWQLRPDTIDFMRITAVQSIVTDSPQILRGAGETTKKAIYWQNNKMDVIMMCNEIV